MTISKIVNLFLPFWVWLYSESNHRQYPHIQYHVYSNNVSMVTFNAGSTNVNPLTCVNDEYLFVIFQGYSQTWTPGYSNWYPDMINEIFKLQKETCVILVDTGAYTEDVPYPRALSNFDGINQIIAKDLAMVVDVKRGINPADVRFFGTSYGAQMALAVGKVLAGMDRKISRIDVCEPTDLGFRPNVDHKPSAYFVQGIFTDSTGLGTMERNCHQHWNMGHCGTSQEASNIFEFNSWAHFLCVQFYISSFTNSFKAIEKPTECTGEATPFPSNLKMGFHSQNISGTFYAATSKDPPYN